MDVMTTPTAIATAPTAGKPPPGSESETPPGNPTSYKRHAPPIGVIVTGIVTYKECLKNHAATMGGHALDGCGEFMPAPTATAADPTSLKCAACGCHRNFHRREPEDHFSPPPPSAISPIIEYHPHHRHHPPPPSPPPISSAYYPGSAPAHMLLALSGDPATRPGNPTTRKRFRTKFTQEQKERMQELAEKVGWKMQKHNEDLVRKICSEIGVERGVFKVWMHNNKNTSAKRPVTIDGGADQRNGNRNGGDGNNSHSSSIEHQDQPQHDDHDHHHDRYNGKSNESNTTAPANASSSSS